MNIDTFTLQYGRISAAYEKETTNVSRFYKRSCFLQERLYVLGDIVMQVGTKGIYQYLLRTTQYKTYNTLTYINYYSY